MKKGKYIIIGIAIASVAAGAVFLSIKSKTPEIRNVILISIDTCRADHLSCYGYRQKTTPNIDALAESATVFKNAVSPVPITLPAHSSMLTGTIPPFHGVHNNMGYKLAQSNQTLAEILKQNGFNTAAIVSAFVLDEQFGLGQGFDTYDDKFEKVSHNKFGNERRGDETTEVANKWLKKNKDNKSFLMVHYYDPHIEYSPPEPFASKYADNLYAGEIAFTDHCIGQFIQKLKDLGMYDSTLLIIASDHGEMLGEHGEEEHTYFIYESAIKVPFIVKLPGQKKGLAIDKPVGLVDIVPTVCSVLGIEIGEHVQGKDLTELLQGKAEDGYERFIYSESITPTRFGANSLMSISTGKWKYIQSKRPELYDVVADSGEENNLIEKDTQRGRILEDKLREILERSVRKDINSQMELDAQSIKRLESLGYIAGKEGEEITFDKSKEDPKDLIGLFVQFQKVIVLTENKEYKKAKKIAQKLVLELPQFHELYLQLGSIAMYQGKYDDAVLNFKKLIELQPDIPEYLVNLSSALYKKGDYKQAAKYAAMSIGIDSDNIDAHVNLALSSQNDGDLDQAEKSFLNILKLSPENVNICNSLANLYVGQEKLDQSLEFYRRSLKINPNQPTIMYNLAWLEATNPSLESGNLNEAVMLAEKLCKITNFRDPRVLDILAIAYAAKGKFTKAMETGRKAVEIASAANKIEMANDMSARLELYKKSTPYTTEEK